MRTLEVLEKVLKGKRVKDDTKRHYRDALKSLAEYSEEYPQSGVVINEWLGTLTGYSDMTVRNWFNYVNSAGKYMAKAYKMVNPCDDANRPKVAKKRRRYFTAVELVRIIKACRFEQDKVLVLTLIDSTCRIGELVGLKANDVGDSWIDVKGKTGERRYRCDNRICEALKRLGSDGKAIFKGRFGAEADVVSLKHRVRRVIKEAGITGSKLGAHTLRHSGASLVAQETGSALAVKALLQHDKIETSMEYIHDAEDVLQQRISPLRLIGEKVFGESGGMIELEAKQIPMVAGADALGNELGVVDGEVVEVVDQVVDFLDEQFPEISDGVAVRPLLKTEDLRLMRRLFMVAIRSNGAGSDEMRARVLMKRIIKKVKD